MLMIKIIFGLASYGGFVMFNGVLCCVSNKQQRIDEDDRFTLQYEYDQKTKFQLTQLLNE